MTLDQFEKAEAKRKEIDKLKSIFPVEARGWKPNGELNIRYELSNGKPMHVVIPQYLSENILNLIEKRIVNIIELEEQDFKKL